MSDVTPEESQLLVDFRNRISDIDLDNAIAGDIYLVRFIRARDHKLKDAEQMFRNHINWRRAKSLGDILKWQPPRLLVEGLPYEICGVDRDNVPTLLVPFGQWDVKTAIEQNGKDTYLRYIYHFLMTFMEVLLKTSKYQQFLLIMVPDDLQMFRQISSKQVVESLLQLCSDYETNCPETLKAAFVVDVPRFFSVAFGLVKPLIHSKTLSKIQISSNQEVWIPALHKLVSPDQLPVRLGGTRLSSLESFNKPRKSFA